MHGIRKYCGAVGPEPPENLQDCEAEIQKKGYTDISRRPMAMTRAAGMTVAVIRFVHILNLLFLAIQRKRFRGLMSPYLFAALANCDVLLYYESALDC